MPYSEKEEAKRLGAKWDPKVKKWYINTSPKDYVKFAKWIMRDTDDVLIATEYLYLIEGNVHFLVDIINHINKTDLKIEGVAGPKESPMEVENLLIHTDDYGGVREWALLGFTNNVLRHLKVKIKNLWLCNPPTKIYEAECDALTERCEKEAAICSS